MFVSFSSALSMLAIGPITPSIITNYGVNHSTAGLLTGITFLVHIPFAIPISMLIGRAGPKLMISLAAFTGSIPLLSFIATDNFVLLLAIRATYGTSFLFLVTAVGPLFMQWFPPKELPLVNGAFVLACTLGITTSSFVVAPFSDAVGWEMTLSLFGGISLLSGLAWFSLGKAQGIHSDSETRSPIALVWTVLRSRITLLVAIADAGPITLLTASMAWLPTFYQKVHGISLTEGGIYMGVMSLASLAALVPASLLTARTRHRRPFLIVPGVLAGFGGFAVLLLPDSIMLYIAVAVLGFVLWFYIPALFTIPMEIYPNDPRRVSLISATLMTLGGITASAAPPAIGAISDLTGSLAPGLAASAVLAWSLVIAGVLLPPSLPVKNQAESLRSESGFRQ